MELEREVIIRAQKGESEAQEVIVSQLAPMIFRLISRFFRSREDVEDLAQEVFARFFLKIDQIRPHDNVTGWFARVTINICYDRLRKLRRESAGMEGYGAEPRKPNRPEFDLYEDLRAAVDKLDAKLRVPLLLKEVEELSVKEISDIMRLSPSNVKIRLYRARKKLAVVLRKSQGGGAQHDLTDESRS